MTMLLNQVLQGESNVKIVFAHYSFLLKHIYKNISSSFFFGEKNSVWFQTIFVCVTRILLSVSYWWAYHTNN